MAETETPKRKRRPSRWRKRPDAPAIGTAMPARQVHGLRPCGRCGAPASFRCTYPGLDVPEHRRETAFSACSLHYAEAARAMIRLVREDGNTHWAGILEALLGEYLVRVKDRPA